MVVPVGAAGAVGAAFTETLAALETHPFDILLIVILYEAFGGTPVKVVLA